MSSICKVSARIDTTVWSLSKTRIPEKRYIRYLIHSRTNPLLTRPGTTSVFSVVRLTSEIYIMQVKEWKQRRSTSLSTSLQPQTLTEEHPRPESTTPPAKLLSTTKENLSRQGSNINRFTITSTTSTKQSPATVNMVAGRRVGHRETARIRAYLEDTTNPLGIGQIAEIMGVSRRTIERLRLNFELFDAPYPPTTVKLGRPPTLTEEQQGVCKTC